MTQESAKKRGGLVVQSDPSYDGQPQGFIEEDNAWRAFLENPLTVASKAMMSVNGDEDSANALGLLYDYYKVPKEKRTAGHPKVEVLLGDSESDKINFSLPVQETPLAMTTLRNVPLSTVVQGISGSRRKKTQFPETDTMGSIPSYSGSPESTLQSYPSLSLHETQGSHSNIMTYSRHLNQHQYSSRNQDPDSTYADSYKDSRNEVFPQPEELQLRMAPIPPEHYSPYSTASSQHFEYMLEAPQSLRPKHGSTQMSYLNKGQFYPITLRDLGGGKVPPQQSTRARSVVMLLFGDEKFTEDQLKHWRYWHSRQHTAKQRCIDIADYKESFHTISNIEEIAFNAISFTWDTKGEGRIFVSVNCLSTDFSPQKGVRGLPLNLQIDTYLCGSNRDKPVHRAYSQIKVFCDKGAERKIRDEDRKQSRRKTKALDPTLASLHGALHGKPPQDFTMFKPVSDMETEPVLFIPDVQYASSQRHTGLSEDTEESLGQKRLLYNTVEDFDYLQNKRTRRDDPEKVLLYVRKEAEEVFDALMLRTPTLAGLLEAVTEKYELPLEKMGKVYKRCKKGILVHMDDNIIKHYTNEDAFQIHMEEVGGQFLLTLTEI
ncbi:grainyhead-like protein 1 homolog [Osmerus mordax]|uniref:grainyhead-like protein 1 homolog n=1 Tax=Osmerus mordax TaxID=8014 RepID=UPI00350EB96C